MPIDENHTQDWTLGVAITPDGKHAYYVANNHGDTVSLIETATNTVVGSLIPVGNRPVGVAVTPNGKYVFVTNNSDNTVSMISTATHSVVGPAIGVGNDPADVVITLDGRFAYVANGGNGAVKSTSVSVINIATDTVVGPIMVGNRPLGIDISPDGKYVYVSNSNDEHRLGDQHGDEHRAWCAQCGGKFSNCFRFLRWPEHHHGAMRPSFSRQ